MGFVRSTLVVKFDDPDLAGFEVRSKRLSVDALLTISSLRSVDLRNEEETRKAFDGLSEALAEVLTSWNLDEEERDDNGEPTGVLLRVPLNKDTLRAQDFTMVFAIAGGLLDASVGVSPPLSQPSNDGAPSVEASIPMEPLSGNPTS